MPKNPEYHPLVPKEEPYVDPTQPPKDKYHTAWFLFLILGTGILLPWNAFINAGDYFTTEYSFFSSFMFFLALAYNWSSCSSMLLSIFVMHRFSFGSRAISSFLVDLVVLMLIPFLTMLFNHHTAMYLTFVGTFITGIASSILFGTIFGLAALFPPKYSTAIMSGNGVAGVLSSLLRIITKVSEPDNEKGYQISGIIFFVLAAGVILICIVSYFVLMNLPVTQFYVRQYQTAKDTGEAERLINSSAPQEVSTSVVLKKVWKESVLVWSAFFVTLALFPGITSLITPTTSISSAWFGILMVATFTVGDFIGRTLPKWFVAFSVRSLWLPTILRFSFFVLFPLCVKRYINADAVSFILMAVFAISNGYMGTLAMMFGPTNADSHEKEKAGLIMSFALNFGIFCGVHFALLILYLLTGSIGVHI